MRTHPYVRAYMAGIVVPTLFLLVVLLVVFLIPGGIGLARLFDTFAIQWQFALPMFPIGMAVYYLAWKHVVAFLNEEMGIA